MPEIPRQLDSALVDCTSAKPRAASISIHTAIVKRPARNGPSRAGDHDGETTIPQARVMYRAHPVHAPSHATATPATGP
jgi:hypothetical protein